MVDLTNTIIAKSDQLNADDLMGGRTITIRITRVAGMNDKEQPIAIYYDGDNGKPYKPGKSMRRVLVNFWGKDGESYVGRWLTLYRDPEITFGKIKVGGIRISHMSDIGGDGEMALAVTKGAKRLFTVKPLVVEQERQQPVRKTPEENAEAMVAGINRCTDLGELMAYVALPARVKWIEGIKDTHPDLFARVTEAQVEKLAALGPPAEDGEDNDTTEEGEWVTDPDSETEEEN